MIFNDRDMERLTESTLKLAALVEEMIREAIRALCDFRPDVAHQVICGDEVIDRLEVGVEEECLRILALYAPVAGDLRRVAAVLNTMPCGPLVGGTSGMKDRVEGRGIDAQLLRRHLCRNTPRRAVALLPPLENARRPTPFVVTCRDCSDLVVHRDHFFDWRK